MRVSNLNSVRCTINTNDIGDEFECHKVTRKKLSGAIATCFPSVPTQQMTRKKRSTLGPGSMDNNGGHP